MTDESNRHDRWQMHPNVHDDYIDWIVIYPNINLVNSHMKHVMYICITGSLSHNIQRAPLHPVIHFDETSKSLSWFSTPTQLNAMMGAGCRVEHRDTRRENNSRCRCWLYCQGTALRLVLNPGSWIYMTDNMHLTCSVFNAIRLVPA